MVTAALVGNSIDQSIGGLPAKEQHLGDVLRKPCGTFPQDFRGPRAIRTRRL
jgi:hypothetical protein